MSEKITHKYVGGGYYPGLPAQDLNEAHLTHEQVILLKTATEKGLYAEVLHPTVQYPKKAKPLPAESPAEILSEDSGVS